MPTNMKCCFIGEPGLIGVFSSSAIRYVIFMYNSKPNICSGEAGEKSVLLEFGLVLAVWISTRVYFDMLTNWSCQINLSNTINFCHADIPSIWTRPLTDATCLQMFNKILINFSAKDTMLHIPLKSYEFTSVLDSPGIESRWVRDFWHPSRLALESTHSSVLWARGLFPEDKASKAWRWPPTHI
jgi:hypothetical protein